MISNIADHISEQMLALQTTHSIQEPNFFPNFFTGAQKLHLESQTEQQLC